MMEIWKCTECGIEIPMVPISQEGERRAYHTPDTMKLHEKAHFDRDSWNWLVTKVK